MTRREITTANTLPLIAACEERDRGDDEKRREIHARCVTMERACRAIGFGDTEGYERVAVLVVRVAGAGVLQRTSKEIAKDKDVNLTKRHVERVLLELGRFGLLHVDRVTEATKKRGRPKAVYLLRADLSKAAEIIAEAQKTLEKQVSDFWTFRGHDADTTRTSSGHDADTTRTSSGHLEDRSYLYPLTLNPSSPSSLTHAVDAEAEETTMTRDLDERLGPESDCWEDATDWPTAIAWAASIEVEHLRTVRATAEANGVTPVQVAAACYVVRHHATLTPGSLVAWLRTGGWPVGRIRPPEIIRGERRARAEAIRLANEAEALGRNCRDRAFIDSVTARRLKTEGLSDCLATLATPVPIPPLKEFERDEA